MKGAIPLHQEIASVVNGELCSRWMRLLAILKPNRVIRSECRKLLKVWRSYSSNRSASPTQLATRSTILSLPVYDADNTNVSALADACRPVIECGSLDILVQGSLGTGEEVAYSDFDAIAVLNEAAFESPKRFFETIKSLYDAREYMYRQDPLQHHGWFVIPFTLWRNFPQNYLPVTTLSHSKSLLHVFIREIQTSSPDRNASSLQLESLCTGIRSELSSKLFRKNSYTCKSMLSKFLLLPTIYLQMRDEVGVFKRESFAIAESDFPADAWKAMERASEVRRNWLLPDVNFSGLKYRTDIVGAFARKRFAGPLSRSALLTLDAEWINRAFALVTAFEKRAANCKRHATG